MFNLLVKSQPWRDGHDRIDSGRAFEYTGEHLEEQFKPEGIFDFDSLFQLPALFVQETGGEAGRLARVGRLLQIREYGREFAIDYSYESGIPAVPNEVLNQFRSELGIAPFEFERTHWAVKEADLYGVLLRGIQHLRQHPTVFNLPNAENIDTNLVSVMMPFDTGFSTVYSTIRQAAADAGLNCLRADDFWEAPAIIQDVVSLIDRSHVVVCDCSGRNSNVFYEVGIAHTLGREVILLTQSEADIPFDLRHLRYIRYLNNAQGRRQLKVALSARLSELAAAS
jgi:hypothetical protein